MGVCRAACPQAAAAGRGHPALRMTRKGAIKPPLRTFRQIVGDAYMRPAEHCGSRKIARSGQDRSLQACYKCCSVGRGLDPSADAAAITMQKL